jgi:hypothetical protein
MQRIVHFFSPRSSSLRKTDSHLTTPLLSHSFVRKSQYFVDSAGSRNPNFHILDFCDPKSLFSMKNVNSFFYLLLTDEKEVGYIWKKFFHRSAPSPQYYDLSCSLDLFYYYPETRLKKYQAEIHSSFLRARMALPGVKQAWKEEKIDLAQARRLTESDMMMLSRYHWDSMSLNYSRQIRACRILMIMVSTVGCVPSFYWILTRLVKPETVLQKGEVALVAGLMGTMFSYCLMYGCAFLCDLSNQIFGFGLNMDFQEPVFVLSHSKEITVTENPV